MHRDGADLKGLPLGSPFQVGEVTAHPRRMVGLTSSPVPPGL